MPKNRDADSARPTKGGRKGKGLEQFLDALRRDIDEVARRDGPVLVGPFTGEVGFELLYWLPMIRWAVREFPSLAGRLTVISRGGVEQWWRSFLDVEYVDILSFYEPGEYVARKGVDKQKVAKGFDDEILARVRSALGITDAQVLHPSLLFQFYFHVRKGNPDVFAHRVKARPGGADGLAALYDPLPRPTPRPELEARLPDDFVAARFYFRDSFPVTEENRAFAVETISKLARRRPVVLLNTQLELDEHSDIGGADGDLIFIDDLMRADDNLSVQTETLGRARAFVGTYGGLAYLAPFLGVPAIGFSSLPEHAASWHLALAQRLFAGPDWAPLITLRTRDVAVFDVMGV